MEPTECNEELLNNPQEEQIPTEETEEEKKRRFILLILLLLIFFTTSIGATFSFYKLYKSQNECDINCDIDGDGECDYNCDNGSNGKCDYDFDDNENGKCDYNDEDGKCDNNCPSVNPPLPPKPPGPNVNPPVTPKPLVPKVVVIEFVDGPNFTANGILPGWQSPTPKKFTVTNTGESVASYNVGWKSVINTFSRIDDLIYSVERNDVMIITDLIAPTNDTEFISSITLEVGETHSYEITFNYLNQPFSQNEDKGKIYTGLIQITANE